MIESIQKLQNGSYIKRTIFEWNSQFQITVIASKDIYIGDTRIIFIHSLNSQSYASIIIHSAFKKGVWTRH